MRATITSKLLRGLRLLPVALALTVVAAGCADDDGTNVADTVPSVVVSDQTLASPRAVVVDKVDSPVKGWIVIHEDNGAGAFGGVIGFAQIAAGSNADVSVTLDRDALNGEALYAMLHVEAGETDVYEFPGPDVPATTASGDVIAPAFTVLGGGVGPAVVPAVSVVDQKVSPKNSVVVAEVTSSGPGFIVIHEDDGAGSFGAVIGHTAVVNGVNADVRVTLSRDAVNGETLYAMLHTDAGTVGTYEFPGPDAPVTDAGGAVITPSFKVLSGGVEPPPKPAVTVAAQTADPANQVVVAEVISSGPGFIVIHEDDGAGSFGAVLGHTAVVDGKNTAVKVTLSRDAVDGETLYAMLHTDAGVVGTYEFPGPDGPVLGDAGAPISPSFVVSVAAVVTNDLAVADQGLEPVDAVVVASVVADVAGWVVIHEDDGAGAPGDAIGNAAVPAGSSSDVVVGLGRQAVEGETLYAMLHIDAGVADVYEFPGPDAPAKDAAGAVVVEPFTVTLLQRLEVSTNSFFLPTDPINVATVDHVVMKAQGFVVIHEDDGAGSFGAVIGYAQVPSGSTTAVKVTLDRDLVAAEVLWPMLHVDLGAPGVYEFPGADVPATDETGAVLVKSFDVEFVTP